MPKIKKSLKKEEIPVIINKPLPICPRCGGKNIIITDDVCTCLNAVCRKIFYNHSN